MPFLAYVSSQDRLETTERYSRQNDFHPVCDTPFVNHVDNMEDRG